ncbi:hypothetical protein CTA1_12520 [Colletotrichum tanaceti]|uniref:Uncharacterized protein n=1 Tax=Colletotrichum tanaceti TaxID=1306861 RepID=A0A4U6XCY3_9PEZI|nr:hypothetical protein CTA1_12520 [Colletotrichum tanaceti]
MYGDPRNPHPLHFEPLTPEPEMRQRAETSYETQGFSRPDAARSRDGSFSDPSLCTVSSRGLLLPETRLRSEVGSVGIGIGAMVMVFAHLGDDDDDDDEPRSKLQENRLEPHWR